MKFPDPQPGSRTFEPAGMNPNPKTEPHIAAAISAEV
jgi:hypothetical protein